MRQSKTLSVGGVILRSKTWPIYPSAILGSRFWALTHERDRYPFSDQSKIFKALKLNWTSNSAS